MAPLVPDYVRLVGDGERDLVGALLEMTEAQLSARGREDDERRMRMANFPFVKTLADFDWSFQPSVPRGKVEELASLAFLERGENVILVGSPGVGKTHLSVAIGYEAVMAHRQVYFADCAKVVRDLESADERGTLDRRWRFYEHCSLLIVDELGYLGIDKRGADLLFQLVNRRYRLNRSTVVTTNVGVGRWGEVFGDGVTASAIADRLCHRCTILRITGRSYRLKDLTEDDPAHAGGKGRGEMSDERARCLEDIETMLWANRWPTPGARRAPVRGVLRARLVPVHRPGRVRADAQEGPVLRRARQAAGKARGMGRRVGG